MPRAVRVKWYLFIHVRVRLFNRNCSFCIRIKLVNSYQHINFDVYQTSSSVLLSTTTRWGGGLQQLLHSPQTNWSQPTGSLQLWEDLKCTCILLYTRTYLMITCSVKYECVVIPGVVFPVLLPVSVVVSQSRVHRRPLSADTELPPRLTSTHTLVSFNHMCELYFCVL